MENTSEKDFVVSVTEVKNGFLVSISKLGHVFYEKMVTPSELESLNLENIH